MAPGIFDFGSGKGSFLRAVQPRGGSMAQRLKRDWCTIGWKRIVLVPLAACFSMFALAQTDGQADQNADQGRTIYGEACLQCHTSNQVMLQRKAADGWLETVYTMIGRGAQIVPEDIEPLVLYLTANYGPESPINLALTGQAAGTHDLPSGNGRGIVVTKCGQCHSLATIVESSKPEAEWRATIERMVSYGAVLGPDDVTVLLDYLTAHYTSD